MKHLPLFGNHEYTLGILGGGQLGKMLCQAASNWDIKTAVMDKARDFPAAHLCHRFVVGDFSRYEDVYAFGKSVDLLTIEIENINIEALERLESEGVAVHPSPKTLRIVRDKVKQKEFYQEHGLPVTTFRTFENAAEVKRAVDDGSLSLPFVQKSRSEGYDGRGVLIVRTDEDIKNLIDEPCLAEKLVDIAVEIAVIAARNHHGEIRTFPPVAMHFHPEANLVEYLYAPAGLGPAIEQEAIQLAQATIEAFDMTGLLAVEMFLTEDGNILLNEVAPRPHNSGHHTIESCSVSQFSQHILAISGMPLIRPELLSPAVMTNLLGAEDYSGPVQYEGIDQCLQKGNVHIHLYGKKETRPFRKMGHVTVLDRHLPRAIEKAKFVQEHLIVRT
jgi:5-(carboxyamino)imidazole ribonucleotide synthase